KADCLRLAGEAERACRYYDRARAQGVSERAILGKAAALTVARRFDDALRTLQELGDRASGTCWRQRGFVYHAACRYGAAVAAFDRALLVDPEDAYALAGRGETHRKRHDFRQALLDFDRASRLAPFHRPTWMLVTSGREKAKASLRRRIYPRVTG
ncbi:MAG TPA: tetratricopeptide repeat protein, partial [Myxococcota bacterium]|nr:tetratricopeptide repeat protein [Myxococcota bacterium]